uniref:Uncharacterized protein LOC111116328 n=1 Tax=Crassostrea virginica TaxID=6565 RepID=A0A8B8C895_CRAVI|nr:uncharacterized protein LOC111116328 [Crassostrea virginica]
MVVLTMCIKTCVFMAILRLGLPLPHPCQYCWLRDGQTNCDKGPRDCVQMMGLTDASINNIREIRVYSCTVRILGIQLEGITVRNHQGTECKYDQVAKTEQTSAVINQGKTAQAVARTRSTLLPKESVDTTNPALTQAGETVEGVVMVRGNPGDLSGVTTSPTLTRGETAKGKVMSVAMARWTTLLTSTSQPKQQQQGNQGDLSVVITTSPALTRGKTAKGGVMSVAMVRLTTLLTSTSQPKQQQQGNQDDVKPTSPALTRGRITIII